MIATAGGERPGPSSSDEGVIDRVVAVAASRWGDRAAGDAAGPQRFAGGGRLPVEDEQRMARGGDDFRRVAVRRPSDREALEVAVAVVRAEAGTVGGVGGEAGYAL